MREILEALAKTEREHASAVAEALRFIGARQPMIGRLVAMVVTGLGWVVARLGEGVMLRADLFLEKLAARSYEKSAEQFAAWGEEMLASKFRIMAAAEEDHARQLRTLTTDFTAAPPH